MSSDRKEEIIEAALGLAAERGLGNVSMAMIAERVGIRKPSLYNHQRMSLWMRCTVFCASGRA